MSKVEVNTPAFPLFGILAVVLTVLKLVGVIDISWWWIVAAFFAPIIIFAVGIAALGGVYLVTLAVVNVSAFVADSTIVRKLFRRPKKNEFSRLRYEHNRRIGKR